MYAYVEAFFGHDEHAHLPASHGHLPESAPQLHFVFWVPGTCSIWAVSASTLEVCSSGFLAQSPQAQVPGAQGHLPVSLPQLPMNVSYVGVIYRTINLHLVLSVPGTWVVVFFPPLRLAK